MIALTSSFSCLLAPLGAFTFWVNDLVSSFAAFSAALASDFADLDSDLPEPDEDDELPEFELDEELSFPPLSPLSFFA